MNTIHKLRFSTIILIAFAFFAVACKNSGTTKTEADAPTGVKTTVEESVISEDNSLLKIIKNMKKVSESEVPGMKRAAQSIMDHRYKQSNKKAYIILDKDLWEYEFIFTGKEMTKPGQLEGSWIDFNEDLTYSYGYYDQQQGTGIYSYDLDSGLLLLIDNSDKIKPQEFEAKLFDKSMIMDGNEIYKDNNYNSKLRRITEKPIKIY